MASRLQALWGWFDARMPTIGAEWRKHAAAYYVPKNLNLWYELGALAGLALIIQIVSGIFLTMHYKPDAALNANGVPVAGLQCANGDDSVDFARAQSHGFTCLECFHLRKRRA